MPARHIVEGVFEAADRVTDHADTGDVSANLMDCLDDSPDVASDHTYIVDDEYASAGNNRPVEGGDEVVTTRHLLGVGDVKFAVGRGHEVLHHAGHELLAPALRRHDHFDAFMRELLGQEAADEREVSGVGVDPSWLEGCAPVFTRLQGSAVPEYVIE